LRHAVSRYDATKQGDCPSALLAQLYEETQVALVVWPLTRERLTAQRKNDRRDTFKVIVRDSDY
jgi:hypothetical protein